jgi:hypothetical protein
MFESPEMRDDLVALQRERLRQASAERAAWRRRHASKSTAPLRATFGAAALVTGAVAVTLAAQLLHLVAGSHGLP